MALLRTAEVHKTAFAKNKVTSQVVVLLLLQEIDNFFIIAKGIKIYTCILFPFFWAGLKVAKGVYVCYLKIQYGGKCV